MNNKEIAKKASTVIVNKSVVSTAGLITILLIILKVTDNIDIGWLWCFAAYWLPICIIFGFIGIFMVGAFIVSLIFIIWEHYDSKR